MEENFLNFKKKNENETELYIYGNIEKKSWIDDWFGTGDDKTNAYSLKDALMKVDTPNLTVRINSYGGSVSEGLAIYSLLSEFNGHLKTIVDGFACSAASIIFMAGQERVVPEQGLLMIHNAWSYAEGDSNVMKKMAEDLEKITRPSLNIYVSKTGQPEEKIKQMMDREEWITSKEAYELGFSTEEGKKEAMQALEANFVYNLVMKTKELQKTVKELKVQEGIPLTIENIKEAVKEVINDNAQTTTNNQIKEDSWESFFNKKNNKGEEKNEN